MFVLKKHYFRNVRSLLISKHNLLNRFKIPKLSKMGFIVKSGFLKNKKIWVLLFWLSFLISGQKPKVVNFKKQVSFKESDNFFLFKTTLSGKKMYNFLLKYTHLILPGVESRESFYRVNRGKSASMKISGYIKYSDSSELYHFLSNSDLFLVNHIEVIVNFYSTNSLDLNCILSNLRCLQVPMLSCEFRQKAIAQG